MGEHDGEERSPGAGGWEPAVRGNDPQLAALGAHLRPDEGPEAPLCHPIQRIWKICRQTVLDGKKPFPLHVKAVG